MEVLKQTGSGLVDFNTCSYMSKEKHRYYKPARWAGRLEDLTSLSRVCRCPPWVVHVQVRGKETTVKSGVYPTELVDAVAAKIVSSWKRTLNLEFWREELKRKGEKLSELQQKWLVKEEARVKKLTARMPEQPLDLEKEIRTPTVILRGESQHGPRAALHRDHEQESEAGVGEQVLPWRNEEPGGGSETILETQRHRQNDER